MMSITLSEAHANCALVRVVGRTDVLVPVMFLALQFFEDVIEEIVGKQVDVCWGRKLRSLPINVQGATMLLSAGFLGSNVRRRE
jgi:hypothetical protein